MTFVERFVADAPKNSFLVDLLAFRAQGRDVPLLDRLETRLVALEASGWDMDRIGTRNSLRGTREHFFAGVAEVFGLAWFASRGLLRQVGVSTKGETISGKLSDIDGIASTPRGAGVLFDIKSFQAHVDRYLDLLCEEVKTRLQQQGRMDLNLSPHRTGAADVKILRINFDAIKAKAVAAIPEMLKGRTIQIWDDPGFRLRGSLRKGHVRSSFSSVEGEIVRCQELLWTRCSQLSTRRPFLIVLVRTPGMGIDVPNMIDLVGSSLRGHGGARNALPMFGSVSRESVPKAKDSKFNVQRFLSGVLVIDEKEAAARTASRLFVNSHATYPLPRRLRALMS